MLGYTQASFTDFIYCCLGRSKEASQLQPAQVHVECRSLAGNSVYSRSFDPNILVSELIRRIGSATRNAKLVYGDCILNPSESLAEQLQGQMTQIIQLTLIEMPNPLEGLKLIVPTIDDLHDHRCGNAIKISTKTGVEYHVNIELGARDFAIDCMLKMFAGNPMYVRFPALNAYERCFRGLLADSDYDTRRIYFPALLPYHDPFTFIKFLRKLLDGAGTSKYDDSYKIVEEINRTLQLCINPDLTDDENEILRAKGMKLLYAFLKSKTFHELLIEPIYLVKS